MLVAYTSVQQYTDLCGDSGFLDGGQDEQITDDLLTHPVFLLLWKSCFLQNEGKAQLTQLQQDQCIQMSEASMTEPNFTHYKLALSDLSYRPKG